MENPEDSIICPLRLILVLALRTGNLFATNEESVLEMARQRHDRMV